MLNNPLNIKKIFAAIFFITIFHNISFSQRIKWQEGFESADLDSKGWTVLNRDSSATGLVLSTPFTFFSLGLQGAQDGNHFIKLDFDNANDNNFIDDWIITPRLYNIHEDDSISFWCGAIDRTFKDSLKVWISVSDNLPGSFTLLDHFKVNGPVGSWYKKSYDLSNYKGKNIYFAVNYYLKNAGPLGVSSDNVWIDNFKLTGKGFGGTEVKTFVLNQNFPNPFNPSTDISFGIPNGSVVTLKIYDTSGKEILTLADRYFDTGIYTINFDGSNLSSGVYFYKIVAGDFTETKKMELIK